jgi:hypothetical protein
VLAYCQIQKQPLPSSSPSGLLATRNWSPFPYQSAKVPGPNDEAKRHTYGWFSNTSTNPLQ